MDEPALLQRLRAGDERAFRELVEALGGPLARLARSFTRDDAVVAEAVQETWLGVIRGLHGFEGRSALRTWIFGILVHQARRLAVREHRHRASSFAIVDDWDDERVAAREPGMSSSGHWLVPPTRWGLDDPESAMLGREVLDLVREAVEDLPNAQRAVVLLRDLEGLGSEEACNILGIEDTHQRVLLHRGRSRVRQALDRYLQDGVVGDEAPARRRNARP